MTELRNILHIDAQNSTVDENVGGVLERAGVSEDNEADAVLLNRHRLRKMDHGLAHVRH